MSNDYWKSRSLQRMLEVEKSSEEAINKVVKLYSNSLEYIQKDINNIIKTYANNGSITKDIAKIMLNKTETDLFYKNLLKTIDNIQDKTIKRRLLAKYNMPAYNFRISRLEALKEELYVRIKQVADIETIIDKEKFENIINYSYYNTIFDFQHNLGYVYNFANINDNLVNVLLADKWVGKGNYSNRIWNNTEILAQQLQKTLASNLIVGRSISKMSKELEEKMNVATHNAVRLIRTEANYFCNQAELLAYKESETEEYIYLATLDTKTCSICGSLDLEIFQLNKAKVGVNYPPIHANDRCTTIPKVDFAKLKTRIARDENGKNIKVPVDMSYKEWYNKYVKNKNMTESNNLEVNDVQYIGNLDKEKLGKYKNKICTEKVIITNERIEHTQKRHPGDYEKYIEYVPEIIKNPDYILDDSDNENTILILKTLLENNKNVQVVVKLQTNKEINKYNSILTFWHIRDRNYRTTIKNNKLIYKKLDKNE